MSSSQKYNDVTRFLEERSIPNIARNWFANCPTVNIVNKSTVVSDADVFKWVAAAQVQLDRDFQKYWGFSANLVFNAANNPVVSGAWVLNILDDSDQVGALGYHTLLAPGGLPTGNIFAKTDIQYGLNISVTLTHEIMEMIADPYVNTVVFIQDSNTTGTLIAYEVCDPVENDELAYEINGIKVSNFVTPQYFETGTLPGSVKFDFAGVLSAPLTIAAGGYLSTFSVSPNTTGWSQTVNNGQKGARLVSKTEHARTFRRSVTTNLDFNRETPQ